VSGKDLFERLKKMGFKAAQLAELLNISEQHFYSKVGAKDIKVSFLLQIAEATNTSVYHLLDLQPESDREVNEPPGEYHSPQTEKNLNELLEIKNNQISELKKTIKELNDQTEDSDN
jgi:plasmid maintenance system antidote protein VapI